MLSVNPRKDSIAKAIVSILAGGEQCECDLKKAIGIPVSWPSYDLEILRNTGIIRSRRVEDWTYYSLTGKEVENSDTDGVRYSEKPSGVDLVVLNRWINSPGRIDAETQIMRRHGF